jgi:hypothetical protein
LNVGLDLNVDQNEEIIIKLQRQISDLLNEADRTQKFIEKRKNGYFKMKEQLSNEITCKRNSCLVFFYIKSFIFYQI